MNQQARSGFFFSVYMSKVFYVNAKPSLSLRGNFLTTSE